MKKKDYKAISKTDLHKEITETGEKLRLFRFGGTGSKSKNVREGRALRRNIARLKTALGSHTA